MVSHLLRLEERLSGLCQDEVLISSASRLQARRSGLDIVAYWNLLRSHTAGTLRPEWPQPRFRLRPAVNSVSLPVSCAEEQRTNFEPETYSGIDEQACSVGLADCKVAARESSYRCGVYLCAMMIQTQGHWARSRLPLCLWHRVTHVLLLSQRARFFSPSRPQFVLQISTKGS